MKICAYVQNAYAKKSYKNECLDQRQFYGLRVIIDALNRNGYEVDWAGSATVHEYDIVLVSLTSDCDWWPFIQERLQWRKGNYKVIVGGAGVLNVCCFTPFVDYFSLGRGEESLPNLIKKLDGKSFFEDDSIVESDSFSPDKIYSIRQGDCYSHSISMGNGKTYTETAMGCNHKCLFCGYTWHRKFISDAGYYKINTGLFDMGDRERAMLDIKRDPDSVNFHAIRNTAIDGMSERLRFMVNKRIRREDFRRFIGMCLDSAAKPHIIKLYNLVGLPTETKDDWREYEEDLRLSDREANGKAHRWMFELHCTPFRPMPATPLACAPASKNNYRGMIGKTLGVGDPPPIIYNGKSIWSLESIGTDSLSTEMLSMLAHRGEEKDAENIEKLCKTKKFWVASSAIKEATLEKYFDMDTIFGEYTPQTLPTRYLRTYCAVEKAWERPPWKEEYAIKP